jgi:hypothetical protein
MGDVPLDVVLDNESSFGLIVPPSFSTNGLLRLVKMEERVVGL